MKTICRLQHSFIVVFFILGWNKFITIFTKRIFTFSGLLFVIKLYSYSFIFGKKLVWCTFTIYLLFRLITTKKIYFWLYLWWVIHKFIYLKIWFNHFKFRKFFFSFFFLKWLIWLNIMILWKIGDKNVNNCSYILNFLLFLWIIISQLFIMRLRPIFIES